MIVLAIVTIQPARIITMAAASRILVPVELKIRFGSPKSTPETAKSKAKTAVSAVRMQKTPAAGWILNASIGWPVTKAWAL